MTNVQVKIELGHQATPRPKPTKEGFTHDWKVYVRGPDQCNISHFVEKVVFHLHETFENPKRVCKEPPYVVQEHGYAGFELPIDIYFRNKADPKKHRFPYNLFLQMHEPVYHSRCEKITFPNPTEDFKKKLLKAGGVIMIPNEEATFNNLFGPPITTTESPKKPKQLTAPLSSKDKPARPSLDEGGKSIHTSSSSSSINNSNSGSSKSKDKSSSSGKSSSSSSSSKNDSGKEKDRDNDGHSSKEKSSSSSGKDKYSSKESLLSSSASKKHSDSPSTKRPPESPSRHHDQVKKLKRSSSSSSFPEKRGKDRDRGEKERDSERDRDRQKEERDREKEKLRQLEREKELKQLEREKELKLEKEKELKQLEREKEKEKQREREKERSEQEKARHKKEKKRDSSSSRSEKRPKKHSDSADKHASEKHRSKDSERPEKHAEVRKEKSPFIDAKKEISPQNDGKRKEKEKVKETGHRKSESPQEVARKDEHRKTDKSLSSSADKHTFKTKYKERKLHVPGKVIEKAPVKEEKVKEKQETVAKSVERKSSIDKNSKPHKVRKSSLSSSKHGSAQLTRKNLTSITSKELIDDLSLSDDSDSSSVSSISSISSLNSHKSNISDKSNATNATIASRKSVSSRSSKNSVRSRNSSRTSRHSVSSHRSSHSGGSRSASRSGSDSDSEPATRITSPVSPIRSPASSHGNSPVKNQSALGTMIAELDESDESEDEIAEPSSVFSNHSRGSRSSPGHRDLPQPHSNHGNISGASRHLSPGENRTDKGKRMSVDSHDSNVKVKRSSHNRKSLNTNGNLNGASSMASTPREHAAVLARNELVHSDSKGFDLDRVNRSSDTLSVSSKSSFNIGDEAPRNMLESPNGEDLTELVALQRKLMSVKDPAVLVKVVMLIQNVGKFKIGDSTFDFDLCSLDSSTVQEIRTYLSQ